MAKLVFSEALASTTIDQQVANSRLDFDYENFGEHAARWQDDGSAWFVVFLGDNLEATEGALTGGGGRQDYVQLFRGTDFTIERHGHDTVLDFGHGDALTLRDVDRADFSRAGIAWIEY